MTPTTGAAGVRLHLSGEIGAELDLHEFAARPGALVLDLDQVQRITSFGVREWIRFLGAVRAESVWFVRARPSIVAQFNMVAGFAAGGTLVSFYLPYLCEECDAEVEVLLDLRAQYEAAVRASPPEVPCPRCGRPAEFDDVPETYFSFVAGRPEPKVPEGVARLISGEDGASAVLRVQKEVEEGVTALWLSGMLDDKARLRRAADGVEGAAVFLLGGIDGVSIDGGSKLAGAVQKAGAQAFIARVRPSLVDVLAEEDRQALWGRAASFLLPAVCSACGVRGEAEVFSPVLVEGGEHEVPGICASCAAAVTVTLSADHRAELAPLVAASLAPDVLAYLRARPGSGPPASDDDTNPNAVGTLIAEKGAATGQTKYEILRRIGTGGMAEVLLARQLGLEGFEKKVVIKRILPQHATNQDFIEMFLREARLAARINHPNVVQIYELGRDGAHWFIAMEYVRGWDLRTAIGAAARLDRLVPVEVACRIAIDVCAGLHAAHTHVDDEGRPAGVIHRDVSPHNVLLSLDGAVKVADFGISKTRDSSVGTMPGTLKGKIMYMAPEQVDAERGPVDALTDGFAVGLVLHECLTGMGVFRRPSEAAALHAVLNAPIPSVRQLRPELPEELSKIVEKATSRERSERFPSCAELQRALERFVVGAGLEATSTRLSSWLAEIAEVAQQLGSVPRPGLTPSGTRTGMSLNPWSNVPPTAPESESETVKITGFDSEKGPPKGGGDE